jgi:CheY-like chemotaxis protein
MLALKSFWLRTVTEQRQCSKRMQVRAVVTDVDLNREITGWDIARRARELYPDIPIVYMTGANADEWTAMGVPESVLIAKPFVPAQMVTAVSHLLNAATSRAILGKAGEPA